MSAERLREAARVLRERAEAASHAPWRTYEHHGRDPLDEGWSEIGVQNYGHTVAVTYPTGFENEYPEPDATYIATMHPGVGLALADWLEMVGAWIDEGLGLMPPDINIGDAWSDVEGQAHKVADLILGDAP